MTVMEYYSFMLDIRVSIHPSVVHPYFYFLGDNLNRCQLIFTKLGVCSDIVEIWFVITNEQVLSVFDIVICSPDICILVSRQ